MIGVTGSALAPAAAAGAPSGATLDVGLVTAALPLGDGSGDFAVPVVTEVGAAPDAPLARGTVQLVLRDAEGRTRASLGQPFQLEPAGASAVTGRGLRLYAEFRLGPGSYTLEAAVKDDASGATGGARSEIRLAERAEPWIASPALVVDRGDGWRTARAEQPPAELPFAFVAHDGSAFLPAATLEVGAADRFRVQALVATQASDFPFVVAEAVERGGRARPIPVAIASVAPGPVAGVLALALDVGPMGAAGESRLRLGLRTAAGALETPIGAAVTVRARAAKTPPPATASAGGPPALEALVPVGNEGIAYRRILATAAEAGVEASAPELVRFELGAGTEKAGVNASQRGGLRAAQRAVHAGLGSGARFDEARIAVAALHLAAAELYKARREPTMAAASQQLASELLNVAARGGDVRLKARAVDLLALCRPAEALVVEPNHALALLRVALAQERSRQFDQASQTLGRLLRAQPAHAEARLRAAVVLRRRGEDAAALEELARVTAGPAADWILELAYSEIATIERRLGRPASAEKWLRQGIERIEAQSLHLQLALYLDQANRSPAATAVVNHLPVGSPDGRASARHLYAREPVEESSATRARVAAAVAAALPALGRALADNVDRGAGR